jgi:anti-sigma B factor antagonist
MNTTPTPFSVAEHSSANHTTTISLHGYLDAHTAPVLEEAIERTILAGCSRIVVDFTNLDYISSAGLGVFMIFIERLRSDGGDIKLAAMRPSVFTVFDLLGFPVLFTIADSAEQAINAFPAYHAE